MTNKHTTYRFLYHGYRFIKYNETSQVEKMNDSELNNPLNFIFQNANRCVFE